MPTTANTLFYGDNLPILREYLDSESVDLVYLDPPFNSSRSYNVLFKDESGHESDAQITAFEDTWHWGESTARAYQELVTTAPAHVAAVIGALRQFIGANQMMAYLWLALSLVRARPLTPGPSPVGPSTSPRSAQGARRERGGEAGVRTGKKGKDTGIDGVITFIDDASEKPKRVLVQVKSGHVKSGDVRDLRGTVEREGAAIGLFITLETPSKDMLAEAASAGFYSSPGWQRDYPRLQILTIADLLNGVEVKMPPAYGTFKQAPKAKGKDAEHWDYSSYGEFTGARNGTLPRPSAVLELFPSPQAYAEFVKAYRMEDRRQIEELLFG